MGNGSIIDRRSENVPYVLPDFTKDIPPSGGADKSLQNATWVVAGLLAGVLLLILGTVIWNAHGKRWNSPD
jgi:hypothetical protein